MVEKQCFALVCGVLAVGMVEKKGAKKVQIELEKKRNDDNLRSCRRSKSVRLLKSSTAA